MVVGFRGRLKRHDIRTILLLAVSLAISIALNLTGYLNSAGPSQSPIDYAISINAGCDGIIASLLKEQEATRVAIPMAIEKQKRDDYSLCLSIESAKAAKDAAEYTRGQYRTAVAGAIVSGFTLLAAIAAAFYAASAAGSANVQARAALRAIRHSESSTDAALDSAASSAKSADVAQKALVVSERPWLSVRPELDSGFVAQRPGVFRFCVLLNLVNEGNSPAVGIKIHRELVMLSGNAKSRLADIKQKAISGEIDSKSLFYHPVFRGAPDKYPLWLTFEPQDVTQARRESRTDIIDPAVVVCVTYRSVFSDEVLHSSFVLELRRYQSKGSGTLVPFAVDASGRHLCGSLPPDMLSLSEVFLDRPMG